MRRKMGREGLTNKKVEKQFVRTLKLSTRLFSENK